MRETTVWRVIEKRTDTGRSHVIRICPDEDKARRIAAARKSVIRAKGLTGREVRVEKTTNREGGIYE